MNKVLEDLSKVPMIHYLLAIPVIFACMYALLILAAIFGTPIIHYDDILAEESKSGRDLTTSVSIYKERLEKAPDTMEYYHRLGDIYSDDKYPQSNYKEAVRYYRQYLKRAEKKHTRCVLTGVMGGGGNFNCEVIDKELAFTAEEVEKKMNSLQSY